MPIHPVRTEGEYEQAMARVRQLMGSKPGTAAADELDVLATLVDAYEAKHFPIDTPGPAAIIAFRMEQQGLARRDLEPMIGSRARVSEVLTGKRSLTLPMIRKLHAGLGIPVDLLVGVHLVRRQAKTGTKRKPPANVTGASVRSGAKARPR